MRLIYFFLLSLLVFAAVVHSDDSASGSGASSSDEETYDDNEFGDELEDYPEDLEGESDDHESDEDFPNPEDLNVDDDDQSDDDEDDDDLEGEDLNLELGPEEKCEMCQHIHTELAETTAGLPEADVKEGVHAFCDTLDEEIADSVFDICKAFISENEDKITASIIAKTDAAEACKAINYCDDEMIKSINAAWGEEDEAAAAAAENDVPAEDEEAHVQTEKEEK